MTGEEIGGQDYAQDYGQGYLDGGETGGQGRIHLGGDHEVGTPEYTGAWYQRKDAAN